MNDDAARLLGVCGLGGLEPLDELSDGLRDLAVCGIERRGQVLTWADSASGAEGAPGMFQDLTGWECAESSFHLEDFVPVEVRIVNGCEPRISEDDQRVLLRQGVAFGLAVRQAAYALEPPVPVRCIISVNETNGTFRFHQVRPGEHWNLPELDTYRLDKMVVLDIEPFDE
jgi:hypothetical protein